MKQVKLFLAALLLIAFVISIGKVEAIEEEILVEKEVDPSAIPETNPEVKQPSFETKPTPQAPPKQTENPQPTPIRKNRRQHISERRALRDLMREMRNYQFGSDLFDFHQPRSNFFLNSFFPRTSFLGNSLFDNDFGDMFLNFDRTFELMRRRMNNMWTRSFLPSLFDENHQFLETHLNHQRLNQDNQEQGPQPQEKPISTSQEQKPIVEKKKREPISSLIKTETLENGQLQYALDINNIPSDIFEKKDIEIKVTENSNGELVSIRAEKKTENGHFEFSKSYRFPKGSLDFENVKASLSNEGTLSVKIPRVDHQPAP